MESFALPTPAYPAELSEISMALFTDLQDAAGLRMRLIKASTMEGDEGVEERKRVDFAFLDGRMIASREHILVAAHQAILSAVQGELHTQTVHSELISHLNPTSNVAEGLRRFGISSKSTSLLMVKIGPRTASDGDKEVLQKSMYDLSGGSLASLDLLSASVDGDALKKIYKLSGDTAVSPELFASLTSLNKTVGVF